MSFLQKLKGEDVGVNEEEQLKKEESLKGVARLDIDLYQTESEIVVYANVAAAAASDMHVSIEGDQDIIIIEGEKKRPEDLVYPDKVPEGRYFTEDIVWGKFYRKIILPGPIDMSESEAKLKNGILVLRFSLKKLDDSGESKKLKIKDIDKPIL